MFPVLLAEEDCSIGKGQLSKRRDLPGASRNGPQARSGLPASSHEPSTGLARLM